MFLASKQSEIENHDDVQPSRISFTPQKYWISYHFVQNVCLRCSYTCIIVTVVPGWWGGVVCFNFNHFHSRKNVAFDKLHQMFPSFWICLCYHIFNDFLLEIYVISLFIHVPSFTCNLPKIRRYALGRII